MLFFDQLVLYFVDSFTFDYLIWNVGWDMPDDHKTEVLFLFTWNAFFCVEWEKTIEVGELSRSGKQLLGLF